MTEAAPATLDDPVARAAALAGDYDRDGVVFFHIGCLHGGAPTWPGLERRSISFRFFGDDIVSAARPPLRDGFRELFKVPTDDTAYAALERAPAGTPIGALAGFQQVR